MSLDLQGAAKDYDEYVRRSVPIYRHQGVKEITFPLSRIVATTHRNPSVASSPRLQKAVQDAAQMINAVLEEELAKLPNGNVGIDQPLPSPRIAAR
jgi:hypothetical protein